MAGEFHNLHNKKDHKIARERFYMKIMLEKLSKQHTVLQDDSSNNEPQITLARIHH